MLAPTPIATESLRHRLKLLLWPLVIALLFGASALGEPVEDVLRTVRNTVHQHPVSGDIVLVEVDEKSLREIDNWPWPRSKQAQMIDALDRMDPAHIVFDILYIGPGDRAADEALGQAIERSGKVTLGAQTRLGEQNGKQDQGLPLPVIAKHASVASVAWQYNWQGMVWKLNRATHYDGKPMPSLSGSIAQVSGPADQPYMID